MKTEYAYDPELPLVVEHTKTGQIRARFRIADDAGDFVGEFPPDWYRVIDTTPKPKIPEDADYVTWVSDGTDRWWAIRTEGNKWVTDQCDVILHPDLLKLIGEAEVTVLVPKETS